MGVSRNIVNAGFDALLPRKPPVCSDVASWLRARGGKPINLHAPVSPEIEPLTHEDAATAAEFKRHLDDLTQWQTLSVVEGATIRDLIGFVILPDGRFCLQGNWHRPYLEQHPAYFSRRRYAQERITGDVYSLLSLWGAEFYHWLHDVLPRLFSALPHLPKGTRFIINHEPRRYQLESLLALGIGSARLLEQLPGKESVVERLWFASPLGHSTFSAADVLRSLSGRMRAAFPTSAANNDLTRIYVSRSKAKTRRISNEDAIIPVLREAGFRVLVCEELSFAEQVRTFTRAKCVVGPHGAGLVNMLFCMEGARVGEITASTENPCYFSMARQLGFSFHRFNASARTKEPDPEDILVNPFFFAKELRTFLNRVS